MRLTTIPTLFQGSNKKTFKNVFLEEKMAQSAILILRRFKLRFVWLCLYKVLYTGLCRLYRVLYTGLYRLYKVLSS